ncbi:hypothetical protein CBR_g52288 [Chara braunii]|uniref:Uncharacterized protein n=1 Tax=Chara braunii TaxID=69332 RepID=A0A388M9Z8_CHABU|nr:hypothetical protein CBR_g52288 [Chara braunii]|eukprot:GBG91401.1 hypothetical protein CBR_g52288 [Chara braunii]
MISRATSRVEQRSWTLARLGPTNNGGGVVGTIVDGNEPPSREQTCSPQRQLTRWVRVNACSSDWPKTGADFLSRYRYEDGGLFAHSQALGVCRLQHFHGSTQALLARKKPVSSAIYARISARKVAKKKAAEMAAEGKEGDRDGEGTRRTKGKNGNSVLLEQEEEFDESKQFQPWEMEAWQKARLYKGEVVPYDPWDRELLRLWRLGDEEWDATKITVSLDRHRGLGWRQRGRSQSVGRALSDRHVREGHELRRWGIGGSEGWRGKENGIAGRRGVQPRGTTTQRGTAQAVTGTSGRTKGR